MVETKNSITKYIPNIVTILSLISGLSSIKFSLSEDWKIAIYLILLASIFDFFDGWFARKLKKNSNFGAELDSLSDFISFGVAPSILIFLWSTNSLGSIGWSVTLFFVICSALRLARFTADIYVTNKPIDSNEYFTGVPSPAAAGLILLPVFIYFEFESSILINQYLNLMVNIVVGFLMISKIPTLSIKKLNINNKYNPWVLLILIIISIGFVSNLWLTLTALLFSYIISIFYFIYKSIKIN
ncbi:MAG: CDP-diacylglycerol--serine O-phosphatidyltransferase [Pelagibacteraceae bacterium]|nr:CDP-diacylglycerol--serine O-phosphatidyltransferase [Pelagibacteraceae bacterium]